MALQTRLSRTLPDQITITNYEAYQVRIARDGDEYSASFTWTKYADQKAALQAAVEWRDRLLAILPPAVNGKGSFRRKPMKGKVSWGRVGVTRYIKRDQRRPGRPKYLVFGVNWTDHDGEPRIKQFQAGRVETLTWEEELHAALTAEAFRTHWEFSRSQNVPFDPEPYLEWKETCLYPFEPDRLSANSGVDCNVD